MKVILNQDVENLGEEGDIKIVADGYGRNYLIPKGFALLFSKHAVHLMEQRKAKIEARKEDKRKAALSLREKLQGTEVLLKMPSGENGKLFGAVTGAVIADALATQGVTVEKRHIHIQGNSIKVLGNYEVKIRILEKEYAPLKVVVQGV